jgi:hypothetical protein
MKLNESIDEESYHSLFEKTKGEIFILNKELETLYSHKEEYLNLRTQIDKIKSLIEDGGPIEKFDKYLFEAICGCVIIGDENDPYLIKFIFKTKTDITMSASEYILKQKVKPINGVSICSKHTKNVKIDPQENMDSTCETVVLLSLKDIKNN